MSSSTVFSVSGSEQQQQKQQQKQPNGVPLNLSDPPPPADFELTKQIHLQTPIGLALDDALQEWMDTPPSPPPPPPREEEEDRDQAVVRIDPESILEIRNAYGQASYIHTNHPPPAAVLRGRLHHYNRVGGQWRIVAQSIKIQPRRREFSMTKHKIKKQPIWQDGIGIQLGQHNNSDNNTNTTKEGGTNGQLEILAFDDI